MNAITPRAASGAIAIPPHLPMPPLPTQVAAYLTALDAFADERRRFYAASPEQREGMMPLAPSLPSLTGAAAEEAQRLADGMAAQLSPVSIGALRAWLAPVNAACRNPQGREDFEARMLGIHALCEDLPHGAFTADARRSLPEFFPSAADVRTAVEPGARKLRSAHTALVAAAKPQPKAEPAPEPSIRTAEDIERAKALAAETKAYLRGIEEPKGMEKVKPAYLSPGQLLRVYEGLAKEGNAAAKMRVAAIRKQMEQGA